LIGLFGHTNGIGLGYDMGGVYACVRWISCGCVASLGIAHLDDIGRTVLSQ
jgi:hypothetical protein